MRPHTIYGAHDNRCSDLRPSHSRRGRAAQAVARNLQGSPTGALLRFQVRSSSLPPSLVGGFAGEAVAGAKDRPVGNLFDATCWKFLLSGCSGGRRGHHCYYVVVCGPVFEALFGEIFLLQQGIRWLYALYASQPVRRIISKQISETIQHHSTIR